MSIKPETIIIGAGAAGLAAGAALATARKTFVILEARDRIGGRVHTVRDAHWPLPIEFGAEFIHGRPKETWNIVHRAGLHAFDVVNEHWGTKNGKPIKGGQSWSAMEAVMKRLARVPRSDMSFTEFLRHECADLPKAAKAMAKAFVEGLDAADANVVSAISIRQSEADGEKFDADTSFRLTDGYDRVLQAMIGDIPPAAVVLETVVRSIQWSRGKVVIETTDGQKHSADRVIITLPIGVLRSSDVRFEPPLPPEMSKAIGAMRMGPVVKVLLRFQQAFWEKGPWRDSAFVHQPGGAFPTWWTMLPMRLPVMTGWAGGPAAEAMSHRPASEVLFAALGSLSPMIGVSQAKLHEALAAWHVSDWQADPFARGAYAYVAVGGADAAKRMSKPIQRTLFFAGEATHPGYAGTVAAAIASGQRAARQVLRG